MVSMLWTCIHMLIDNAIGVESLQSKSDICNVHAFVVWSCFDNRDEYACLDELCLITCLLGSFLMFMFLPWFNVTCCCLEYDMIPC